MGLGKTVQMLALLALIHGKQTQAGSRPSLLVVPASLVGNWQAECLRFTPSLRVFIAHTSESSSEDIEKQAKRNFEGFDLVLVTYGGLHKYDWVRSFGWNVVILDEAQAIKNVQALQTQAAKSLKGKVRLALTGTPIEEVMDIVTSKEHGLFPSPQEITMRCSCPDYATMCKHIAAVLYGIGTRLDGRPELLFVLRAVDHEELIREASSTTSLISSAHTDAVLSMSDRELAQLFDIELSPPSENADPQKKIPEHTALTSLPKKKRRGSILQTESKRRTSKKGLSRMKKKDKKNNAKTQKRI